MSIPDYVAGFLYGLTGDLNLVTIEACYNSSTNDLLPYAERFIYDLIHFNVWDGFK